MYDFAKDDPLPNLQELHARLSKLTDERLRRFGTAAASLCNPTGNFGKAPRKEPSLFD